MTVQTELEAISGPALSLTTPRETRDSPLRRDTFLLLASTIVVGIGNYGFSLGVVWLLRPVDFSEVASLSALLLVIGSASSAALPWALARTLSKNDRQRRVRAESVTFTLLASIACGLVAACAVVVLSARYASGGAQAATAITAFFIFTSGVTIGYLQGHRRFLLLAMFTIAEVTIKFGAGIALASTSLRATGAMTGAAIGSGFLALVGVWLIRHDIRLPTRATIRMLGNDASGIGLVQLGVSLLVTLDIVTGSIRHGRSSSLAGYQAMVMFTRLPLFASIAISMVVYPYLTVSTSERRMFSRTIGETLMMYLAIGAAAVAVVATLPVPLLREILPKHYAVSAGLLVPLSIAGFSAGLVNLTTTFFQAARRFRPPMLVLLVAVVVGICIFTPASSSTTSLAWASASVLSACAITLVIFVQRRIGVTHLGGRVLTGGALLALEWVVLARVRDRLVLWFVVAGAVAIVSIVRTRLPRRESDRDDPQALVARRHTSGTSFRRPRTMRWLTNELVKVMRPLAPPSAWEMFVAARSLAGDGPAVVVPAARRVLVVAPHPDDETIGCGGTMALLAHGGCEVRVVVASDGEVAVDRSVWSREVGRQRRIAGAAACERLGAGRARFLGLPDTDLARFSSELVYRLASEVAEFDPDIVFAPWPLDAHDDHRAVASVIARLVLRESVEIWSYEVWSSLPPNRLVDVSEWWEDKTAALSLHRLEDSVSEAHLALQRWHSLHGLGGSGYAEAFLSLTPAAYRNLVGAGAR